MDDTSALYLGPISSTANIRLMAIQLRSIEHPISISLACSAIFLLFEQMFLLFLLLEPPTFSFLHRLNEWVT